jgi:hypothetical protein
MAMPYLPTDTEWQSRVGALRQELASCSTASRSGKSRKIQGMGELGYVEGKDFVIEWRSVEGKYERIPEIATELVGLKVDVVVTATIAALPTLKRTITAIPIVMANSTDPVGNGLVMSLARPGAVFATERVPAVMVAQDAVFCGRSTYRCVSIRSPFQISPRSAPIFSN